MLFSLRVIWEFSWFDVPFWGHLHIKLKCNGNVAWCSGDNRLQWQFFPSITVLCVKCSQPNCERKKNKGKPTTTMTIYLLFITRPYYVSTLLTLSKNVHVLPSAVFLFTDYPWFGNVKWNPIGLSAFDITNPVDFQIFKAVVCNIVPGAIV